MTDLCFPIGNFERPGPLAREDRDVALIEVAEAPSRLRAAVSDLSPEQLDTPYRPAGWTVRQVVHHLPDSHLNSYVRFKLALTEDRPDIRTYDQALWNGLPDAAGPIDLSLDLLETLHERWVYLLSRIGEEAWSRELVHPDLGAMRIDELLAHYAWHGRHHVAHITKLREREGW